MPILHNHKAIFIHIPKAGGTSIEELLCDFPLFKHLLINKYNWYGNIKNNEISYELDHSTMAYLKNNCKYFDNTYYSFTIVRNPYARLVSEYHYCKYQYTRLIKNTNSFKEFILEIKENFDYIKKNKEKKHLYVSHYLPQYMFTHNYKKKKIVDDIFKLENIQNEWKIICNKLQINLDLIKTEKNATQFKYNYEEYYDDELKNIVYDLYKDDFEIFNYNR